MIEISCELKTYDLTQAERLVLLRKPGFRLMLGGIWILPFAALMYGAAIQLGMASVSSSVLERHPESGVSLLLLLTVVAAFRLSTMTSVAGPVLQTVQISLNEIVVTRPKGRFETTWSGIQEVTYVRREVFLVPKSPLFSTDQSARIINIPIPKRTFADDAAVEAFLLEVRGFWKAAGNSAEPGDTPPC